jgi:hypothetical protein
VVKRIENGMYLDGVRTNFGAGDNQVCDECWNPIEECTCDDGRDEPEDDEEPATLDRMQRLVDDMGKVSAEMHAILNRRGVR